MNKNKNNGSNSSLQTSNTRTIAYKNLQLIFLQLIHLFYLKTRMCP